MAISCCYGCVPPKRTPTCHGSCKEYAEQKAAHDAEREREIKKKIIDNEIYSQRGCAVAKAYRKRKR